MSEDALFLGVDLGTQSAKVVLVDATGRAAASASAPMTSNRRDGIHEQDPRAWVDAVANLMCSVLEGQSAARVQGVSFSSTSGTVVVVDANGHPQGPALMYDDARAADLVDMVADAGPQLWARLGYSPQATWAVSKLAWLARHRPMSAGDAYAFQGDVIAAAIVGHRVASDENSVLKAGYDTHRRCWSETLLHGMGTPAAHLPDVVASGSFLGTVHPDWSQRTGLPAGMPVFAGTTDGCAAQFAAGALSPGEWHSTLGTTLVIKGVTRVPLADDAAGVYSHRAPVSDHWLPGGASSVGAGAISASLPGVDLERVSADARSLWGAKAQIAYPLLARGERFPINAPRFDGFLLSPTGERAALSALTALPEAERFAAICLGVAAVERLCFDRLGAMTTGIARLTSAGGGTSNREWLRVRATMLDTPIHRLSGADSALGAAMLAAWGPQRAVTSFAALAQKMTSVTEVIPPDPSLRDALADTYARFIEALTTEGLM